MGITRATPALIFRDDFGSDTSADYYASDSRTLTVASGALDPSDYCAILHDSQHTGKCVTIEGYRPTNYGSPWAAVFGTTSPGYLSWSGYGVFFRNSTALWTLYHDGGTILDTDNVDSPGNNDWAICRLFVASGSQLGWCGTAYPLTAGAGTDSATVEGTESSHNHGSGTVYSGMLVTGNLSTVSYYDVRPGYKITMSGLGSGSGYKVQVNANSSYKATESAGIATLSVALLEWPLTSVEVLDASDAQVAQVTNATYADMGGGDAFAYAADITFTPKVILV